MKKFLAKVLFDASLQVFLLGLLFIFLVAFLLVSHYLQFPQLVQELFLLLCAIIGVHLLERAWLWREFMKTNSKTLHEVLADSNRLLSGAARWGLTNIYSSRLGVVSELRQRDSLRLAEKRVLFLGVGLSEDFRLADTVNTLRDKKEARPDFDVRILMLDAFRSPAVFRTILESTPKQAKTIIDIQTRNVQADNPYFGQRLFLDFQHACGLLMGVPELADSVRFYGHTPSCWLLIVDEVAYFQPYTFGRNETQPTGNLSIGALMPVFRFEDKLGKETFQILYNHFDKMWRSCDTELCQAVARTNDRLRLLGKVLQDRHAWLQHVHDALYTSPRDRRMHPRKPCSSPPTNLEIDWEENGAILTSTATIRDYSCHGFGLDLGHGATPPEGSTVHVRVQLPLQPAEADLIMQGLLQRGNQHFRVAPQGNRPAHRIGLHV